MEKKKHRHFKEEENLFEVLREIAARINHDYRGLAATLCQQIRRYYAQIPQQIDESGQRVKAKLLVGLSGGVDSSVVAYLATKAVGVENVIAITMPAREGDKSVFFSNLVRERLGMNDPSVQYVISISEIVKKEIEVVNSLRWEGMSICTESQDQTHMDRMRIGNFSSRARIAILYDIARRVHGRLLGTGNRAEFVQGYAAKYGTPISFDFGVLDELYKTDIYALAKVLHLPGEITSRVPSTGYFPGQTHEAELGATWEEQDALAFLLFEKKKSKDEIVSGFEIERAFVETMLRRYERSKDKRMLRQPHIKIGFIDDGDL
ncbi:MAG: NAD(+) synthase [Thermodesulfobacteriota bacterium]|nr:NAD(+) synthase [Thermodesulfobacteriota bacterium]